jgi:hypothetical protein
MESTDLISVISDAYGLLHPEALVALHAVEMILHAGMSIAQDF